MQAGGGDSSLYLHLLNRTPLERTLFCGRPENGPAPFVHLERRCLGIDDIPPLFNFVWEFMRFDDQHHVERYFYPSIDPKKSYWSTGATTRDVIAQNLAFHWMHVWTYDAAIDIGNDSKPVRVLIRQGFGALGSAASCGGDDASGAWDDTYTAQRAFVLSIMAPRSFGSRLRISIPNMP